MYSTVYSSDTSHCCCLRFPAYTLTVASTRMKRLKGGAGPFVKKTKPSGLFPMPCVRFRSTPQLICTTSSFRALLLRMVFKRNRNSTVHHGLLWIMISHFHCYTHRCCILYTWYCYTVVARRFSGSNYYITTIIR